MASTPNCSNKIHNSPSSTSKNSSFDPSTSSTQRQRSLRRSNSVSLETDRALLTLLLSPHRFTKFSEVCNRNVSLYGTTGSSYRKSVQNRRHFLQNLQGNKESFQAVCEELGIDIPSCHLEGTLPPSQTVRHNQHICLPPTAILQGKLNLTTVMSVKKDFQQDIEEYTLNLKYPELNPNGMMVFRANDIECNTELIDTITIYKPLFDGRDIKKTKAVLHEDGGGITITEPHVPHYMINEVKQIHQLEGQEGLCIPTMRVHRIAATDIRTKPMRREKQVALYFPDESTCKIDNVNKHSGNKLKNNFRMLNIVLSEKGEDGEPLVQLVPFLYWKLTIDGETRQLERSTSEDSDDDFTQAQSRMSSMKLFD